MTNKTKKSISYVGLVVAFIALFIQQRAHMGPFRIPIKTDGRVKTKIPFAGSSYIGLPKWHSSFDTMYSEKVISESNIFYFPRGAVYGILPVRIFHPFYSYNRYIIPKFSKELKGKTSGLFSCCWTVELSGIEVKSYEAIAEEDYLPKILAAYDVGDEKEAVRIQVKLMSRIFSSSSHWHRILKEKSIDRKQYYKEISNYYLNFAEKYFLDERVKSSFIDEYQL